MTAWVLTECSCLQSVTRAESSTCDTGYVNGSGSLRNDTVFLFSKFYNKLSTVHSAYWKLDENIFIETQHFAKCFSNFYGSWLCES